MVSHGPEELTTPDKEKKPFPWFISSPWFAQESIVLIMFWKFVSFFLLKAQIWDDMAHHKLHRWYSTVSLSDWIAYLLN